MRLPTMLSVFALILAMPAAAGSQPATPAVAEAARSPRIAAVLAAREKLDAAVINRDMATIETIIAAGAVLNGPNNRINDRASIIANITAGKADHGTLERSIEYVGERGKDVILMGKETARPREAGAGGKAAHRRFTDIWTETAQGWQIVLRQATVYERE